MLTFGEGGEKDEEMELCLYVFIYLKGERKSDRSEVNLVKYV